MSNGGITAEDVINLGEFGGPMGVPRGKPGGRGIIRVGGYRPSGGRAPAGRAPARGRVRTAAQKLRPTRRRVGGGAILAGAGMLAAGAAAGARGARRAEEPPSLRRLARAFTPGKRGVTGGLTSPRQTARNIQETAAAVERVVKSRGVSSQEAGRLLRDVARRLEYVKETRKRMGR